MIKPEQLEIPFERPFYRTISPDEIYDADESNLLRFLTEDRRIERKSVGIHAKELGEYLSMWSNTPPDGGLIVIGMSNDGVFEGIHKSSVGHINDLEKAGDIYSPDTRYDTKRIRIQTAKGSPDELLLIRVYYNERKVTRTSCGKAYARRGDSKRKVREDELVELQRDKGEVSFEQEDSVSVYPSAFNLVAINQFATELIKRRNLNLKISLEELLCTRRLGRMVKRKFIPNKALALLFAKDPCVEFPGCKIRFLRFDGTQEGQGEKFNAVKDEILEGSVPELIYKAEKLLEGQLREFSRLGKDGTFQTAPEYPKPAWYEAIVNACCHRSYGLRNQPIFIKLFDDRLEVESPGGFLPFVNPANIEMHHPRNPQLMDAMFYLDYVKCAHEGVRRMRATMEELSLPLPEFSQKETSHASVKVVLRNNIEHRKVWLDSDATAIVGAVIFKQLSTYEKRVINCAAEYKSIGVSQTQRLTGLSWPASKKLLDNLVGRGLLIHKKRDQLDRDPQARYYLRGSEIKPAKGKL